MKRVLESKPPKSSEITPESIYLKRRTLLVASGLASLTSLAHAASAKPASAPRWLNQKLKERTSAIPQNLEITPEETATQYNNFYEFGLDKTDPAQRSEAFKPYPWSITVSGACEKPGNYQLEDFVSPHKLEDRIYRFRCVEAWSMVIPWVGVSLAEVLKRFSPTSSAKYVTFETLFDPSQFPEQKPGNSTLPWPYQEGLRIDEAMHPLALFAVGMYGKNLPSQNGAPLRLVLPWKYGFKSIKSIVKINFQETVPPTTWSKLAPDEYGFYANVNPSVDHPRWSQARERRLPNSLWSPNWMETLPFNGYAEEVASLYQGMDLTNNI